MTVQEAYVQFKELYDFAEIGVELESIAPMEELMKTPAAPTSDSGLAYEGAILFHTIMVWYYVKKVASLYKAVYEISDKALAKVTVLHQLGKVGMFSPNTDDWQVKKLGKVYSFVDTDYCLKTGDRTRMLCSNAGIKFTPEEYEAVAIMDKTGDEYDKMVKYRTPLSTVLRTANDIAFTVAQERYKQANRKQ